MFHFNLSRSNVDFTLRFVVLFLAFYYFNIFYLGITDPQNYYVPFLDRYLNYISWFTSSILRTANLIDHFFGLNSFVHNNVIEVYSGASVTLSYDCLGLGITSFWIAYIIADINISKNKIYWSLVGALSIWVLNCLRIAILLLALQKDWRSLQHIDHHQLFNYISYFLILLMIVYYNNRHAKVDRALA